MKELQKRAELLEGSKQFEKAAAVWARLAAADEQQLAASDCLPLTEVRKRQAGAHFQAGQYDEAISILETLRPQQQEYPEFFGLLARVYLEAKRYQEAVDAGQRALELEPDAIRTKHTLGRAYMRLAEQAGTGGGALHWQEAIRQFTDILMIYNPRDEMAKELKLYCVRKRDDSFLDTVKSKFGEFTHLMDRKDSKKAIEVLNDLTCMVIEHAIDIQQVKPAQTVQIARDYIKMIQDYSQRSSLDLASHMGLVFAQLHSLAMWAHLVNGDPGYAELDLEQARKAAPNDTLPWLSRAGLMFALQRSQEIEPALKKAESSMRLEHDRFLMAATCHLLGEYDRALDWLDKINIEKFKAEVYHSDRAESILRRLRTEIEDEKEMGIQRTPEDLRSGEAAEAQKRTLGGDAPTVH